MDFFMQHAGLILLLMGLVVVALIIYLLWLLHQIRQRGKAAAGVQQALDETNQTMHEQRLKSIEMICLAARDGDCELSEACIRIKKLLEFYPGLEARPEYRAVQEMYREIRHFATHDDRRALSRREMQAQDSQRYAIEARYRELVLANFEQLVEQVRALQGSRFDIVEARGGS